MKGNYQHTWREKNGSSPQKRYYCVMQFHAHQASSKKICVWWSPAIWSLIRDHKPTVICVYEWFDIIQFKLGGWVGNAERKTKHKKRPVGKDSSVPPPVACALPPLSIFSCIVTEGEEILRLKGMECKGSLETWGLSLHLIQDENHSKAEGCSGHGNSTQFSKCETIYTMCCWTVLVKCDLKKTTAGTLISHRTVILLWKLLLKHCLIWTTPVFYSIFWLTSHDVPVFTDGRVCLLHAFPRFEIALLCPRHRHSASPFIRQPLLLVTLQMKCTQLFSITAAD